ncbi:MAG: hypothetical protein JNL10_22805 [Verrucomicrobiales bacterium]|nr:hypothetical protein [Verrucomicrobiales bacterium]
MSLRVSTILVGWIFLIPTFSAWAHRPYERVAGTFQRADGTSISVVRHHVDGIIASDPVSIQFRLPEGVEIARTPHVFDAVLRSVPSGTEVYQYRNTWFPVASRVDFFDGYRLTDITSERRLPSAVVHFADHWGAYGVVVACGGILVALYRGLRSMRYRGWPSWIQWMGNAALAVAVYSFGFLVLFNSPVSPLVICGMGLAVWAAVRVWNERATRRVPDNVDENPPMV